MTGSSSSSASYSDPNGNLIQKMEALTNTTKSIHPKSHQNQQQVIISSSSKVAPPSLLTYSDVLLRASLNIGYPRAQTSHQTAAVYKSNNQMIFSPHKHAQTQQLKAIKSPDEPLKNSKKRVIGKPLMGPPTMPSMVLSKDQASCRFTSATASTCSNSPSMVAGNKRRRLEETARRLTAAAAVSFVTSPPPPSSTQQVVNNNALSNDEQVFLEAAQRLHEGGTAAKSSQSQSQSPKQVTPRNSAASSPKQQAMSKMPILALKRPPALYL